MKTAKKSGLSRLQDFLGSPSVLRSITGMLAMAFMLLLAVNIGTFVMIQRTARTNATIENAQEVRRQSRALLVSMLDAETAQRGYLLTGRPEFLEPFERARQAMQAPLAYLDRESAADASLKPYVERMHAMADAKFAEMDGTLTLSREGRIGQAIQSVRSGEGKLIMDDMRATIADFDREKSERIEDRVKTSQWLGVATVAMDALAAILVVILAILSAWMVRRYIAELHAAREEVHALNVGLETTVQERTADLVRANDEIQRFAYIVSHDLRAPLVNVMGYTSELEQAGETVDRAIAEVESTRPVPAEVIVAVREDMPEAISFIRASTEKMDRLINAILKLSREGRRNLQSEPLDMTAMTRAAADSVHHQTESLGARIEVQSLPVVESDRLSMEQIIGNLIDNAVKYLDPARPGLITVSGEETDKGSVIYRIADNGRGIAARDHERIFELFRRSGRQDRAGDGLGLAFVRNSVRRIGGSIDVESEIDKGSTFILKFPKRLILPETGGAS